MGSTPRKKGAALGGVTTVGPVMFPAEQEATRCDGKCVVT